MFSSSGYKYYLLVLQYLQSVILHCLAFCIGLLKKLSVDFEKRAGNLEQIYGIDWLITVA